MTMLTAVLLAVLFYSQPWSCTSAAGGTTAAGHCTTVTPTRTYKKCMALPTQQASFAWTFHPANGTLDLAFFGTFISPSGWVAWGINPSSAEMTGTRALAAFSDPATGTVTVLPFVLDPDVKLQRSPLTSRPLDIPLLHSSAILLQSNSVDNGAAVQIHATIKLAPNRTTIHHVWNRGLYVQGYSPTIHPTTAADLASRATFDVLTSAASSGGPGKAAPDWLKPAHGIINALSWGFLLPAGVAVARYLRQCESLGPSWFYAHAAIQITGFLLGVAGFGMGISLGEASPGVTYGLHRGLGIAVICAGSLQSLALLLRPKTTNRYRKYWKSYHHFVGYGCAVIGVVNVFQGMGVMGVTGSYAELCYCLALSTLIGACAAMEVNSWVIFCRKAKEEQLRREMKEKVSITSGSGPLSLRDHHASF